MDTKDNKPQYVALQENFQLALIAAMNNHHAVGYELVPGSYPMQVKAKDGTLIWAVTMQLMSEARLYNYKVIEDHSLPALNEMIHTEAMDFEYELVGPVMPYVMDNTEYFVATLRTQVYP